jgi:hypothetical protein
VLEGNVGLVADLFIENVADDSCADVVMDGDILRAVNRDALVITVMNAICVDQGKSRITGALLHLLR